MLRELLRCKKVVAVAM